MKKKNTRNKHNSKALRSNSEDLLSPTQNVKRNLSRGYEEMIPDPDDVPGGYNPNDTPRDTINESDFIAGLEEEEVKQR